MSRHKGFTLIEVILYISLTTLIAASIFATTWNIIQLSNESERYQAANLELIRIGKRIEHLIQNADSVVIDSSDQILLGRMGSSQTDRIWLENGMLMIDDGEVSALTGDALGISGFYVTPSTGLDGAALFVTFEIFGSTRIASDAFPIVLRGGAETRNVQSE